MKYLNALAAGLTGAVALTVAHQLLHRYVDDAPRMDLMGEQALAKMADSAGVEVPADKAFGITMAGDIIGNAFFYSLAGLNKRKHAVAKGTLLGLSAGLGGVLLPQEIGLNEDYSGRTVKTKILTVAIYTFGGWITGNMVKLLNKKR